MISLNLELMESLLRVESEVDPSCHAGGSHGSSAGDVGSSGRSSSSDMGV